VDPYKQSNTRQPSPSCKQVSRCSAVCNGITCGRQPKPSATRWFTVVQIYTHLVVQIYTHLDVEQKRAAEAIRKVFAAHLRLSLPTFLVDY